jgi:hypothetical protein
MPRLRDLQHPAAASWREPVRYYGWARSGKPNRDAGLAVTQVVNFFSQSRQRSGAQGLLVLH